MSDIPSDIVAEFLSRVPALSLLRFRCVSKTWRSIIDSPGFIKLHLHRTLQTESDRKIVLRGDGQFWAGDLDLAENTNRVHYTKLDCPFESKGPVTNVIGTCHGVLCLGGKYEDEAIALWNPTTLEILNLPSPEVPYIWFNCRFGVGFGYDKVSDDYKVLMIIQRFEYGENEAIVYSMKLKSWKRIDRFPFHLIYRISNGVLASGSLHFKCCSSYPEDVEDENSRVIGAFDLETEEYRLVPQPEFPPDKRKFRMDLVTFEGSLCLMCYYYDESWPLDIWVMKKYAVKESWTQLLTIRESVAAYSRIGGFGISNVKPLAYSRSGKEVFMAQADKLPLWYDLEKRRIRFAEFEINYITLDTEHHLCCGSLVKLTHKNE